MSALAALRNLGAVLLYPNRRCVVAAQLVSEALELDRVAQPVMIASLGDGVHEVCDGGVHVLLRGWLFG